MFWFFCVNISIFLLFCINSILKPLLSQVTFCDSISEIGTQQTTAGGLK